MCEILMKCIRKYKLQNNSRYFLLLKTKYILFSTNKGYCNQCKIDYWWRFILASTTFQNYTFLWFDVLIFEMVHIILSKWGKNK